jgi:predicted PhzF superfamily epimerase YddE/YHI9
MGFRLYQVDAFTDKPFAGNPAAVCLLTEDRPDSWQQSVAAEMNLAETAFVISRDGGFGLRWFTPTVEVDLCGHATLASAHVLWETGTLGQNESARFWTKSGLLTCSRDGGWIEMDFPALPATLASPPPGLQEAVGVNAKFVGKSRFDYLIELETEEEVRSTSPDLSALKDIETRGVIVTGRSASNEFDFVSRFFAPAAGIDEDPATGSSHCCLAPYWGRKLGKTEMIGFQASKRTGVVRVKNTGDRVVLGGQAVTVLRGELA